MPDPHVDEGPSTGESLVVESSGEFHVIAEELGDAVLDLTCAYATKCFVSEQVQAIDKLRTEQKVRHKSAYKDRGKITTDCNQDK